MQQNIPEETTSFVGRAAELARLAEALREQRLVTLVGGAGVGKSRLALHALGTAPSGIGSIYWADLWPLRSDELLAATVADALGLSDHTPRIPLDALCGWVADRAVLLALDSCEHLVPSCRHLVGELLTACPNLTVLTTSREPLGAIRETVLPVPPLAPATEALALFQQRAEGVGRPLRGLAEQRLAAGLCARLDGVPLALELAAAQLRHHTLAETSDRIRSGLDLLDDPDRSAPDRSTSGRSAPDGPAPDGPSPGGPSPGRSDSGRSDSRPSASGPSRTGSGSSGGSPPGDAPSSGADAGRSGPGPSGIGEELRRPARHSAVRTAVGWSHELCRPTERLLWARLTVFPAGFDGGLAEQVCSGGPLTAGELRSCLAGLVNKSVVTVEGGRYRLLDSIREYGRMWLRELGETEQLAARHAAAVVELSRQARTEWPGARQQAWYERIEELYHDVREALRFLLGTDPEAALELAGNVAFFWVCCGHLYETHHYLELALACTEGSSEARTRGLWSLGLARVLQGDHESGRALAEQTRQEAALARNEEGLRGAAYLEALAALLAGRPLAALATADAALRDTGRAPEPASGSTLVRLARLFALTGAGRLKEARREAEALRRECVRLGEYWTRSYTDYQLALIALFEDRPGPAGAHARAMLDAKRRIGDRFGIALGLELLAAAQAREGEPERAALAYGAAAQHWEIVGHPQRGTPEVAPLRDEGQAAARARLGDAEYEALFREALHADRDEVLARATRPAPESSR
ncbi:ATP-binding protein [Streptomyces qinglanensis]|uniref:ATP-binding protein n=1 Tax=Streptomyces qinglanensis TaxID=943816 RepID=UPI0015A502E9|nr:regulator [Streptomyces qinglanensis]